MRPRQANDLLADESEDDDFAAAPRSAGRLAGGEEKRTRLDLRLAGVCEVGRGGAAWPAGPADQPPLFAIRVRQTGCCGEERA